MSKLVRQVFTSGGTWTAPAGVTQVYLLGMGGGQGGYKGASGTGSTSYGGQGSIPVLRTTDVVPNTGYTVTIGAGGSGTAGSGGGTGASTTFGSLATFTGCPSSANPGSVGESQNMDQYDWIVSGYVQQQIGIGTPSGSYLGGLSGGPGTSAGGAGGNGNNAGAGTAGSAAAANSGAGGGGGGYGTTGTPNGGAGGSGILYVMWVE